MDSFWIGMTSAVWLGILTSISPCPLATNIAAISYIGRNVASSRMVLLSGLFYMIGRMLVYLVLGMLIVSSLLAITDLSFFLQEKVNMVLGPILILAGIFLMGFLKLNMSGPGIGLRVQERAAQYGIWGAIFLGIAFALSFCPVSAALFFGSLVPLSVKYNSSLIVPSLYGIGTALPVLLFSFIVAFGARSVGSLFNKLTKFELWARRLTGMVFIIVGIYYTLIYMFKIDV